MGLLISTTEARNQSSSLGRVRWPLRACPIARSTVLQKLPDLIEAQTKKWLLEGPSKTQGNVSRAAELLGISRYTVHRLIRRFGRKREGGAWYS